MSELILVLSKKGISQCTFTFHLNLCVGRKVTQYSFHELRVSTYIEVTLRLVLCFDKTKTDMPLLHLIFAHLHTYIILIN